MLRNGEQLLLAVVIPVIVLVGGVTGAERVGLDLDRTAAGRRPRPRRARAGGDVDRVHLAGDRHRLRAPLRRPQAARRLAAAPLRPARRQGRRAAARRGCSRSSSSAASRSPSAGTPDARRRSASLLAVARRHRGVRRARAVPRRRRCAPRRRWPRPTCLPAAAGRRRRRAPDLGVRRVRRRRPRGCPRARSARRCARRSSTARSPGATSAVLLVWAVLGTVLTARTFKWE